MQLQGSRMGDALVVRLAGDLDLHTAPAFRRWVDEQLEGTPRIQKLVLNMEAVSFVDSSGLGALLGRLKTLQGRGGRLVAVGAQPRVVKLFEMSGLLKLIELADNEKSALGKR